MIHRRRIKAQAKPIHKPASGSRPATVESAGEVAADVAELTAELGAHPSGEVWRERSEARFRRLLSRRLEQVRFRLARRPGKPLPRGRVDEIRDMVAIFLTETSRLIEALPIPPHVYQDSLGPWLEWIEGQFTEHGLGSLWAEIRPHLPTAESPSSVTVMPRATRVILGIADDTLENTSQRE